MPRQCFADWWETPVLHGTMKEMHLLERISSLRLPIKTGVRMSMVTG